MSAAAMIANAWHAEGLRWIASIFVSAADRLDDAARGASDVDPQPHGLRPEEVLSDVRHRVAGYY